MYYISNALLPTLCTPHMYKLLVFKCVAKLNKILKLFASQECYCINNILQSVLDFRDKMHFYLLFLVVCT